MNRSIMYVITPWLLLLFCITPSLLCMESLSKTERKHNFLEETNQRSLNSQELRKELTTQNKAFDDQAAIQKMLRGRLIQMKREKTRKIEDSFSKTIWLQQHPGKTIKDYNKALNREEKNVQKDLYTTDMQIEEILNNIDSLQKRLESPHPKEGRLDIE